MNIEIVPGKYVVAVSGGVDSVVLLDLLAKKPGLDLVVAHFDHGIRVDSGADRVFVENLAQKYSLPYVFGEGHLGKHVSEEKARQARYDFLNQTRQAIGAKAIVTAHHQDDLLETAIINLLRGTGRRGLSALRSTDAIRRPLLGYSKAEIKNYAMKNNLAWHEDSTNADTRYLRNHVRHNVLPKIDRSKLLEVVERAQQQNAVIDELLTELLPAGKSMDRGFFVMLPHRVSGEILAAWLRQNGIYSYDKKTIERLVIAAKTAKPDTRYNIVGNNYLRVCVDALAIQTDER